MARVSREADGVFVTACPARVAVRLHHPADVPSRSSTPVPDSPAYRKRLARSRASRYDLSGWTAPVTAFPRVAMRPAVNVPIIVRTRMTEEEWWACREPLELIDFLWNPDKVTGKPARP